jgi:hypothetical protein
MSTFFSKPCVFLLVSGKSPFFTGLDETGGALLDDGSHGGLGGLGLGPHTGMVGEAGGPQGMPNSAQPLSSPSRSSPHSQGSETGERFSRKVFVGGLPPDIDEGILHTTHTGSAKLYHAFELQMRSLRVSAASVPWWSTGRTKPSPRATSRPRDTLSSSFRYNTFNARIRNSHGVPRLPCLPVLNSIVRI